MEDTSTLPLILAGPILRRATTESVTVWLACRERLALDLTIYDKDDEVGSSIPLDSKTGKADVLADPQQEFAWLGDKLYLTLLTATPYDLLGGFSENTLLSYSITTKDGQVLPEIADVCLKGETRPDFYLSSQLNMLAYGSCRKPHGPSFDDQEKTQNKDSLALLADHLEEHCHTLAERPSHLLLVGDQIYADEVPEPVMQYLQKLAVELMGSDIPLPCGATCGELNPIKRTELKKNCGLTSECEDMHLMSFGEFAAMYLMVFGNRIGFSVPDDAPDNDAMRSLRAFLASQDQVRKTLANIPTYMMFDDHDVTDDWNLNRNWYNSVHSSVSGSRVISNALAAFWAFQSWGNTPEQFGRPFIDILQNHLLQPEEMEKAKLYDFTLRKFHHWSFVLPTTPPVFMLDCRTQRDFGTFNSPPKLLDRYAIDALHEAWFKLPEQDKHTTTTPIFITGTPVFGFSVIEWAQEALYKTGFLFGVSTGKLSSSSLDIESWLANKQGFSSLLNTIRHKLGYQKATFIAGDVHYSFVNRAAFTSQSGTGSEPDLHCLQLTSSALRNTPPTGRYLETLLANSVTKTRRGHSKPESLPWWQRVFFWRFLQQDVWKIEVSAMPGKAKEPRPDPNPETQTWWEPAVVWLLDNLWRKLEPRYDEYTDPYTYWITCRPNMALVYFKDGEVTKQVLLSGDQRENSLTFDVTR